MKKQIERRRRQLVASHKTHAKLVALFRRCAKREITSKQFYEALPKFWSAELGNRLQGAGWERMGKDSDFRALSHSFVRIIDAGDDVRDDVVVEEMDALAEQKVSSRKAFLSEMLCLSFPDQYPILNQPVHDYLADIDFHAPRGASEGTRYFDLAKKLRVSLLQNPSHPAKTLAELDTVIWLKYHR